jgi:uncharacterized protein YndB with AHSA1/START domain
MNATERKIERSLEIRAPRPQVFRALCDPGMLSRWLFATVELTPERGGGYTFDWRDTASPASATGEILELLPDEKLVLSWFMEADGVETTASFRLSDLPDGGTRLRFEHAGLPQEPEWIPRRQQVGLEWDKVLLNLRFLLEEKGEGKHLFYFRAAMTLPAPAQRAFRAWLTPVGLREWLARDAYVIAEEGQGMTGVTVDTGRTLAVHFHRIEPERHLRMTWSEGGVRGLIGVSFWPAADGIHLTLTLRSFALMEGERPIIQALWEKRFQRLERYLQRRPLAKKPAATGRLTVRREIEATPQRAWAAMTDASILRRWFVGWTDFTPRAGSEYTILWNTHGELQGRVEEVRPHELIRYTWDLAELGETTEVCVRILPVDQQPGLCTIELTHSGFGEGPEWEEQRTAHEVGWANVLGLLDFYLRRGAGKEPREFGLRRRVALPGEEARALLGSADGLLRWLAVRAEVEPRDGGRYVFEDAQGTEFRGRLVICRPEVECSAEIESPEPLYLNWWVAPDPEAGVSRVALSVMAYGASDRWVDARRAEWAAALDRLAAGG